MIQITKSGNTATALFTGSDFYLYGEGQIVFPVGSLSVVIDESDFVTFRKAPCNDVLFSAPMSQIEIDGTALTRENAPTLLDSIIGTPSGGDTPVSGYVTTEQLEESELVTAAALNDLNTRVNNVSASTSAITALSADVQTLSGQVSANTSNIATLSGTVTGYSSDISTLSGNVNTLSGQVSTNTSGISTLSGTVSGNSSDISTISGQVTANTSDITSLSGQIGDIATALSAIVGE